LGKISDMALKMNTRNKWITPMLALTGALAFTIAPASAALIYTDNPDITVTPVHGDLDFISFNVFSQQAAFNSSVPGETGYIYYGFGAPANPIILIAGDTVTNGPSNPDVSKLSLGTVIDSSLNYYTYAGYLQPSWSGGGQGIVGFRTSGGNYGWARLDVVPNTSVTLLDFAVESDPGVAINSPSPVPEPTGTIAGMLCLGVAALRRRRQSV
jgi:hypothetical protein